MSSKWSCHGLSPSLLMTLAVLLQPPALADAGAPDGWAPLAPGPHGVGFRLLAAPDHSRVMPTTAGPGPVTTYQPRVIRVYQWYPAVSSETTPLRVGDYARMAAEDFGLVTPGAATDLGDLPLPVPFSKGIEQERRQGVLESEAFATRDAEPVAGPFPLLILGQGLYYESPLSHFVLCEYLASCGYVVATCPLMGTRTRLVNLSVVDLETVVRDLEFVLAQVRALHYVDRDRLGLIGYDLGGMAGLLLSMRNPAVDAFLSLDAGILTAHFSGLPHSHPDYAPDRFRVPWLHATQARFVAVERSAESATLFDRKRYGDAYLLLMDTDNHGSFTSYAHLGIRAAVPGYWGPVAEDGPQISHTLCGYARTFFDAYLGDDARARQRLAGDPPGSAVSDPIARIERRFGPPTPPPPDRNELLQLIIDRGMDAARPVLEKARASYPDSVLFDEGDLNWLGYHFLYWWGREVDAVALFELVTDIYPESANAHDSLGEARAAVGNRADALTSYRRSLELNPDNANAARMIERLESSR